jgi:hypothetical protein
VIELERASTDFVPASSGNPLRGQKLIQCRLEGDGIADRKLGLPYRLKDWSAADDLRHAWRVPE